MAGDGSHGHRCVDGGLAEKVQAQLGILAIPVEQRAVDRVGLPRSGVCAHLPAGLPRLYEHSRRYKERVDINEPRSEVPYCGLLLLTVLGRV